MGKRYEIVVSRVLKEEKDIVKSHSWKAKHKTIIFWEPKRNNRQKKMKHDFLTRKIIRTARSAAAFPLWAGDGNNRPGHDHDDCNADLVRGCAGSGGRAAGSDGLVKGLVRAIRTPALYGDRTGWGSAGLV